MTRHTLVTTAILLASSASLVQAGPGCMNGKQPMGWSPQQAMAGPGYNGYARMPGYGYGMPPGAMGMPQYSPMMSGARQSGYHAPAHMAYDQRQTAASSQAVEKQPAEVAAGENITVRIKGMRFEPAVITVTPGTTITWIQEDGSPHTVTGKKGELQSSTLMGGQSFTHTFSDAGSYDYACNFHPMMKGRVVVEGSAS